MFDDGAFVENFGDVMAGGSDQLDPASEGGMVGASSSEGGEKGVMHIDDALGIGSNKLGGQYLHITSEDDHIDRFFGEESKLLLFGLLLCSGGNG